MTDEQRTALLEELLRLRPATDAGMKLVADRIAAESGERWRTAASHDWESEQDRWVAWLDALTDHDPPPPDAEVLWFEIPSDINPALTSVSAYAYLMSPEDSYGIDESREWPTDERGLTPGYGCLMLPEMQRALRDVGWNYESPDAALRGCVDVLSSAQILLMVLNGLPQSRIMESLGGTVASVMSWAGGGCDPIGLLTPDGWEEIPVVEGDEHRADDEDEGDD